MSINDEGGKIIFVGWKAFIMNLELLEFLSRAMLLLQLERFLV